jgi:hypothetical protein
MGLLSGIASLVFGGQKKTTNSKTSGTSQTDPWDVAIPYLTQYLQNTSNLYGPNGAPLFSPLEQQGYDALKNVAVQPTSTDAAIAANNKTLSGAYLSPDSDPYIADIARRSAGLAGANANATFGGAGRTGSGLAGYYAGKGAADAANDVFATNYSDERNRMLQASGQAPSLDAARYLGPQALISAGQNISARPFDINSQEGSILSTIGQLGQQGSYTGQQTNYAHNPGIIGSILNSFTNKLFPGGSTGPF